MTLSEAPHEFFNGIITQKRQQTSDICFLLVNNQFLKVSTNLDLLTLGSHIEGIGIRNEYDVIEVINLFIL